MTAIYMIDSFTYALSESFLKLLQRIRVTFSFGGIEIALTEKKEEKSIDERIVKIDEARSSLVEALDAIDELHTEAEKNKLELSKALNTLTKVQQKKGRIKGELENMHKIMQTDVTTFRNLAGIPSQTQIRKERYIGFMTGFLASIIASGVIWGASTLWPYIKSHTIKTYEEYQEAQKTPDPNKAYLSIEQVSDNDN